MFWRGTTTDPATHIVFSTAISPGPFVGGGGGNHWKPRGGCGGKAHHCTTEVGGLTAQAGTRAPLPLGWERGRWTKWGLARYVRKRSSVPDIIDQTGFMVATAGRGSGMLRCGPLTGWGGHISQTTAKMTVPVSTYTGG